MRAVPHWFKFQTLSLKIARRLKMSEMLFVAIGCQSSCDEAERTVLETGSAIVSASRVQREAGALTLTSGFSQLMACTPTISTGICISKMGATGQPEF
jgi:hypothetical protein